MKEYRKLLILVLIIGVLSSGVTIAASINGSFEGFPIVNTFVNGKKIEGNVPAVLLNGRTMVPVRFVSEELGANVKWDGNTSTVYITKNPVNEHNKKDINKLKLYSKITNQYKYLQDIGTSLSSTSTELIVARNGILISNNATGLLQAYNHFNERIEMYSQASVLTTNVILEAQKQGIDISDMNVILDNYLKAMEYYGLALDALKNFNATKLQFDFETHLDADNLAHDLIYKQLSSLAERYQEFFNKVQSY